MRDQKDPPDPLFCCLSCWLIDYVVVTACLVSERLSVFLGSIVLNGYLSFNGLVG